jgi:hypothetical protein
MPGNLSPTLQDSGDLSPFDMVFAKTFVAFLFAFALTPASASPVNETKVLSKRGAVLTAQFATESEVCLAKLEMSLSI